MWSCGENDDPDKTRDGTQKPRFRPVAPKEVATVLEATVDHAKQEKVGPVVPFAAEKGTDHAKQEKARDSGGTRSNVLPARVLKMGGAPFFGGVVRAGGKPKGKGRPFNLTGEEVEEEDVNPLISDQAKSESVLSAKSWGDSNAQGASPLASPRNLFSLPLGSEIASPTPSNIPKITVPRESLMLRMLLNSVVSDSILSTRSPLSPLSSLSPLSLLSPLSPLPAPSSPSMKRRVDSIDTGEEGQTLGGVPLTTLQSPPPDTVMTAKNVSNQILLDRLMEEARDRRSRKFPPYRWDLHVRLSCYLVDHFADAVQDGEHAASIFRGIGKGMTDFIDKALCIESSEHITYDDEDAVREEREEFERFWGSNALREEEEEYEEEEAEEG